MNENELRDTWSQRFRVEGPDAELAVSLVLAEPGSPSEPFQEESPREITIF